MGRRDRSDGALHPERAVPELPREARAWGPVRIPEGEVPEGPRCGSGVAA